MNKSSFRVILVSAALFHSVLGCSGSDPGAAALGSEIDQDSQGKGKGKDKGDGNGDGTVVTGDCTYTQGYWKNHASAWPVDELKLGNTTYTKDELLSIFHTPVRGNGLVSMAHQLIAAKLNVAAGATPGATTQTIADADALIGSLVVPPVGDGRLDPAVTSGLNDALTDFNEGQVGPGHCGEGTGGTSGSGGEGGSGAEGGSAGTCGVGGTAGVGGSGGAGGSGGDGGSSGSGGSSSGGDAGTGGTDCPEDVEACDASGACSVGTCQNGCCVVIP